MLIEVDMVDHLEAMLRGIDDLLGLQLLNVPDISNQQRQLVADRELARQTKDWSRSDEIRDTLTKQGIGVRDTNYGAIWYWL